MKIADFNAVARLEEGLAHHQAGRLEDAEACYLDVVDDDPTHTEALKLLSVLTMGRGEFEDALHYAQAAVNLAPKNGDYQHLLGRIMMDGGDLDGALEKLKRATTMTLSDPLDLNLDLAECYALQGRWEDSLAISQAQLQAYPTDVRALTAAATAAASLDKNTEALDYFERAIAVDATASHLWSGAAKLHRAAGDIARAWFCVERALSLSPEDADLHYMTRIIRGEAVPAWHFNMMNDAARNAAFKQAIERQIKPHHVVLEIGTGAGLLAMMAARTGARIYTCESNPVLALAARGIIEANGLADRITVIDKPSWNIEVGADLPQQADVLISEIFSAQMLSEEVIPTIEDAKRRLLKPGGIVIPQTATMIGALVRNDDLAQLTRVGVIEGFDFTPLNAFTPVLMNMDTPDHALDWISGPVDLFEFDFKNRDQFLDESGLVAVDVTKDGLCQGVVQWLQIMLDDDTRYENAPAGANATRTKHWTPLFYPFAIPREIKKGQTVMLRIGHDRKGVRIELSEVL